MADTAVRYLSTLVVTSLHIDIAQLRMDLRAYMPYMKVSGDVCIMFKIKVINSVTLFMSRSTASTTWRESC